VCNLVCREVELAETSGRRCSMGMIRDFPGGGGYRVIVRIVGG